MRSVEDAGRSRPVSTRGGAVRIEGGTVEVKSQTLEEDSGRAGLAPDPGGPPSHVGADSGSSVVRRPADAGTARNTPDSVDSCPGMPLPLSTAVPQITAKSGATASLHDDYASSCSNFAGKDAVYRFTAPGNGRVSATLSPTGYTGLVYVRKSDCENRHEVACAGGAVLDVPAAVTFDVQLGAVYYVFADQEWGLTEGTFSLTLAYLP